MCLDAIYWMIWMQCRKKRAKYLLVFNRFGIPRILQPTVSSSSQRCFSLTWKHKWWWWCFENNVKWRWQAVGRWRLTNDARWATVELTAILRCVSQLRELCWQRRWWINPKWVSCLVQGKNACCHYENTVMVMRLMMTLNRKESWSVAVQLRKIRPCLVPVTMMRLDLCNRVSQITSHEIDWIFLVCIARRVGGNWGCY